MKNNMQTKKHVFVLDFLLKKLYLSPEYFEKIFIRLCVIRKILCIFAK